MRAQAMGANLLVERDPKREKHGEILLPDQAQVETSTGKVLHKGSKVDILVDAGCKVLFEKFAARSAADPDIANSENLVLVNQDQILLALFPDEPKKPGKKTSGKKF